MPVLTAAKAAQLIYPAGRPYLVANTSISVTVYAEPGHKPTSASAQIPPLGSIALNGDEEWFCSTLSDSLSADLGIFPGATSWAPSPAQIAEQIAQAGIGVANLVSFSAVNVDTTGSGPFHTFGASGRIWGVHLSYAVASDASQVGSQQMFAKVYLGSGPTLMVAETVVWGPSSNDSDDADLAMPGFAVSTGDTLNLSVNGGAGFAHVAQRASCVVLCSFP